MDSEIVAELFYDFNRPPTDAGIYWCSSDIDANCKEHPDRGFWFGDPVLIGVRNDEVLFQGTVVMRRERRVGVRLDTGGQNLLG